MRIYDKILTPAFNWQIIAISRNIYFFDFPAVCQLFLSIIIIEIIDFIYIYSI